MPLLDPVTCLRSIATRDARFDGVFYLLVTSPGILCRTVCLGRRPMPENPLAVKQIEARSAAWRPWRGYAVMHLWRSAGFLKIPDISNRP